MKIQLEAMSTDHKCFEALREETESDATFERAFHIDFETGKTTQEWVINLYHYTPSLAISTKRGKLVPTFCPMCGECLEEKA